MKTFIMVVTAVASGILIGWLCRGSRAPDTDVVTRIDTLVVRDTVIESHPVYVESVKVDTMLVSDTVQVRVQDTVYVAVCREQKHYMGDDYEAWVSGYRPQLDSVWVFPETRYITKEVPVQRKPTRWGICIQAGYGLSLPDGRPQVTPYIGVGISYNIIRW